MHKNRLMSKPCMMYVGTVCSDGIKIRLILIGMLSQKSDEKSNTTLEGPFSIIYRRYLLPIPVTRHLLRLEQ